VTIASEHRLAIVPTKEEIEAVSGACQILDVLKSDDWKDCWSEWDQGVRDHLSVLLARMYSVVSR